VIAARNTAIAPPAVEQKVAAENQLSGALRRSSRCRSPIRTLKANQNFQQLQK